MRTSITVVLMLMMAIRETNSARILGITPTASISHQLPIRLILLELVKRGHQVTFITTDPIRKGIQNYTEIDISMTYDYWKTTLDFTSMSDISPVDMVSIWAPVGRDMCEMQLSSQQMKDFLQAKPSFDAVIFERLSYYCYYGMFSHVGSPPLIGFVSLGAPSPVLIAQGNPNNPAYSPDFLVSYTDHMSFWERLYNAYVVARYYYVWNYEVPQYQEEVLRKYFGPNVPAFQDIERNFSLILVNNHFSMNYPRPLLPSVIELTGMHIEKKRKPLPQNVQSFLDGAKHGVIYFSLGTNVKGSAMPENKRRAFLEAFAQLPQRVLWKWEVDSLPGQPENVMISKWLPQQDVLAHPNIKLFITQGGLQSMNEAGYFAVPMIGIPFIGDQHHNVAKMVQAGIGHRLLLKDVTTDTVLKAIHTVLGNERNLHSTKFSRLTRSQQCITRSVKEDGQKYGNTQTETHCHPDSNYLRMDKYGSCMVFKGILCHSSCKIEASTGARLSVVNFTMSSSVTMVLVLLLAAQLSHSARILGIIPTASISHQLPFRLIALELAKRGHQVTVITTDPIRKNIQNYTEIDISITYDYWRKTFDFTSMSDVSPIEMLEAWVPAANAMCEMQLESQQLQDFLRSQPSFDVVILERLLFYCYYGLIHQVGSPPLIGFVTLTPTAPVFAAYGNPNNPAYSPDMMIGYTDHMSFWQRLYNAYVIARYHYTWIYEVMPYQDELSRKYFGPHHPPAYETDRNFTLLLVNNHFSVNFPRPLLPNVIELTGLHLEKQRKPLPQNIQNFLDGAKNGVVYFSLGSNVKSSTMPEDKKRAFLEAFAQLPQRVLWKWEVDSLPGQPENVMISKWLPQQDVLAHPNIKVFITQGGLQSMNEASYFAVPLIGIPFMGDQHQNVAKMVQAGIGYQLLFKDVTTDTVLKAIHTVLGNDSYRENMKRFSAVFRDHQETSLDRAVWWIEYVIRHNGAPHMRTAALDLSWWQLLLLDVIGFVVLMASVVVYVLYKMACCCKRLATVNIKQKTL